MSEFFPQEIIVEILSRLPVKPLCRFKCVSKPWLMLITDPKFIETHTAKRQHQTLIVASKQQLFSVSFESFERKGGSGSICDLEALELDHPLKSNAPNRYVRNYGSCNGFICLLHRVLERRNVQHIQPNVFIFNPCIGMFKQVPVHADLPVSNRDVYGFGYAPSIDDYKLVKICFPSNLVVVYSLKMNSWKTLERFPHRVSYEPSTSVNGAVHWVVWRRTRESGVRGVVIAAFDVANECFKEVDTPDDLCNGLLVLGAINGCLCLWCDYNNVFWIMREYGVKESWCKIVMDVSYKWMKPMCLMKNGEALLLINKERFVLCDLNDGKCVDFVVRGSPRYLYDADVCVETLVSPNLIEGFRVASDHPSYVFGLKRRKVC